MEKYIKSITALNTLTLSNNKAEIDRYSESDIFWAANKNKPIPRWPIKKGTIYQFEFGKNFVPEMSYEHRGLVIGFSGKLLYVLPISTLNRSNADHVKAYHPIDNPSSKSNFYLLKSSEFAFLSHDSVLKLNDMRTVSVLRIKYKQDGGYIDQNSDTFKTIERLVFYRYFRSISYEYDQLKARIVQLTKNVDTLEQEKAKTTAYVDALKKENADINRNLEASKQTIENIRELVFSGDFDENTCAQIKKLLDPK